MGGGFRPPTWKSLRDSFWQIVGVMQKETVRSSKSRKLRNYEIWKKKSGRDELIITRCYFLKGNFQKIPKIFNLVWFLNQVNIYLGKDNQYGGILISRIWRNSRIPLGGNMVKGGERQRHNAARSTFSSPRSWLGREWLVVSDLFLKTMQEKNNNEVGATSNNVEEPHLCPPNTPVKWMCGLICRLCGHDKGWCCSKLHWTTDISGN